MVLQTIISIGTIYFLFAVYSECYMYGDYDISERAAKNYSESMQVRDEQLCELFQKNYTKPNPRDADNITLLLEDYNEFFSHLVIIYRVDRENTSKYVEPLLKQDGPKFIKLKFNTDAAIQYYEWSKRYTNLFMKVLNDTAHLWWVLQWFEKNPLIGTPRSVTLTTENYKFIHMRV